MSQAPSNNPGAFPPRKRVVAREVAAEEVEAANRAAAVGVTREDLMVVPPPREGEVEEPAAEGVIPADPVTVVDPTTLGGRRRRTSHHRLYRWTQACTMVSALLSATAVICTTVAEIGPGRACAIGALAIAAVATVLSGRSSLSERWRGWAIAALVFAAASLALTWIGPALAGEEPVARPVDRTKS
jgi:hypothetical protein